MNRVERIIPADAAIGALAALLIAFLGSLLGGCKSAPEVRRDQEIARFRQHLAAQAAQLAIQPGKPLTVAQCEDLAVANSLSLQVQQLGLRLQDDQVRLALSGFLPHGSAQYNESLRSNSSAVSLAPGVSFELQPRHQQSAAVQGMLPALDFGITYYSYRIAQDRAHQQRLLVDRAEQLLRRDVRIAYARYAGTMRQEKLAAIAYQAAQQVLRVALSLERAQVTVPADTALVEAALAEANVELNRTRQKMHENRLKLAQFMSLPPGVEFTVIAEAPNLPLPPDAAQVASLADRALAARPELAVQDLERHVSANGVRRAFAEFFPRIDLVGSFSWADTPGAVNPAFFTGGYQVAHSLLDGGATLVRYSMAKDTAQTEKVRTLLLSLGVLYDVQLRALTVREDYEAIQAATKLEAARRAALKQILSMYLEGLEDEAGAARSLADLTIQSTVLDKAITDYQVAWYELEAAALPAVSPSATAATQPTSQPSAGSLLDSILPPGISVPGIFGNSTDGGAAAPATSATQPVKP